MSSLSDSNYKAIVLRAVAAFGKLPGVHTVGIGGRERGGKPTGELVLKVFVSQKRPRSQLTADQIVAAEFEGIGTDVVEAPSPKPAAAVPGATLGGPYSEDTARYRPLQGGVQLSGEHCFGMGTLGFIVRTDELPVDRIFAVTAHHALFSSVQAEDPDLRVGQPTGDDSVTKCCSSICGKFTKGYRDATMDAAIIRLDGKTEYYPQIQDIGVVSGEHQITAAEAATLTYSVRKRGRTTLLTGGTIQAIGAVSVSGSPSNYMVIKPNAAASGSATFADHGDSGAAIMSDGNEIVGMLFAMASLTAGLPQVGWGFAWAIQDVLTRFSAAGFDLVIEAGTTLNEKRVVPVDTAAVADAVVAPPTEASMMARKVEGDLSNSKTGQLLTALWMRHSGELNRLVNGNRRVAVQWHRLGGAALLQHALSSAYHPTTPIPEDVGVRPADDCLHDVLDLFDKYGSPALQRDIRNHRGSFPQVGGLSYDQILAAMHRDLEGEKRWLH